MKKSEFEKQVAKGFDAFDGEFRNASTRSGLVAVAVQKAEAAGVIWDPEIPERLEYSDGGLWPEGVIPSTVRDDYREIYYREAAKRYNAWLGAKG